MEVPVKFTNRKGEILFGMFFIPGGVQVEKVIGILISVNSLKSRIDTYRQHLLHARQLCSAGFLVFYFDPAGIGDSEGRIEDKHINEHFVDIQGGKYREDIEDAITFMHSEYPIDRLILIGNCGGAISGLITAAGDTRISGLILLGIPVLYSPLEDKQEKNFGEAAIFTGEGGARVLKRQLRSMFNPRTWHKIFATRAHFITKFLTLCKAIKFTFIRYVEKCLMCLYGRNRLLKRNPVSKHPRYNMLFQKAFVQFIEREGKILFLFGGLDKATAEFETHFQDLVLTPGNPYADHYQIQRLEKANHIFSDTKSQTRIQGLITNWLKETTILNEKEKVMHDHV